MNAKLFRFLSALALLVFALMCTQPLAIAQQDRDPAAPTAQQEVQQQQPDSMDQEKTGGMGQVRDTKTFGGKILKSGDKLVLQDAVGESTYLMDDQEKAKGFEGKDVNVTGTVDTTTRTIHIDKIEPEI